MHPEGADVAMLLYVVSSLNLPCGVFGVHISDFGPPHGGI